MDSARFDILARSLTTAGSRRRALVLVLSGALAPRLAREGANAHNALLKCKRLTGKHKKKCVTKAKKHNATHTPSGTPSGCTPNCTGRVCGDDGCGGSCGTCGNVPCQDVCQGGACLSANDSPCIFGGRCLNGTCNPNPMCGGGGVSICSPANPGACCSKVCNDEICAPGFPGDECTVRTDCNGVGCIGFRCQ